MLLDESTPNLALSVPVFCSLCDEGKTGRICINLLPTELTFTCLAHSRLCVCVCVLPCLMHLGTESLHNCSNKSHFLLFFFCPLWSFLLQSLTNHKKKLTCELFFVCQLLDMKMAYTAYVSVSLWAGRGTCVAAMLLMSWCFFFLSSFGDGT